jgi:hypothetical protein
VIDMRTSWWTGGCARDDQGRRGRARNAKGLAPPPGLPVEITTKPLAG